MSKWIPVSESLPRMAEVAILRTRTNRVCVGYTRGDKTWFLLHQLDDAVYEWSSDYITHWMTLPEPPQEDE